VELKAGQTSSVRKSDSSGSTPPLNPAQATLDMLTQAAQSTDVGGPSGVVQTTHHISKGTAITLGVIAAIPIVVVPTVTRGSSKTTPLPPVCSPKTNPNGCG
jgi:hypothetical protein